MKIIFISVLITHYRVSFFEKLSKNFSDFKVFTSVKDVEDGRPQYNEDVNFKVRGFREQKKTIMGFSIRYIDGMYKAIREERPDVIVIAGIPGNLTYRKIVNWAHRNSIRVIFWYCGWEPNIKRLSLWKKIKKRLALSHYKKGSCFITYSSKAQEDLIKENFNRENITVAYNGIELDDYKNTGRYYEQARNLREKHGGKDVVYLYVGGLVEDKRVPFLVNTFKKFNSLFPGTRLWIIGDGPLREQVLDEIDNHPKIDYFGRIIKDVEPWFIAADYFVLPGAGGLALNQAMFFETPCIAGRADGTERDLVIDDVTGFSFLEDNSESLLSKLAESYNLDKEKYEIMKKNGRELITSKSNVNNMVEVFTRVLNELQSGQLNHHPARSKERYAIGK